MSKLTTEQKQVLFSIAGQNQIKEASEILRNNSDSCWKCPECGKYDFTCHDNKFTSCKLFTGRMNTVIYEPDTEDLYFQSIICDNCGKDVSALVSSFVWERKEDVK